VHQCFAILGRTSSSGSKKCLESFLLKFHTKIEPAIQFQVLFLQENKMVLLIHVTWIGTGNLKPDHNQWLIVD